MPIKTYVICLDGVFYTEVHPWTYKISLAKQWYSPETPERIIVYWKKVHYERYVMIAGRQGIQRSALSGRFPIGAKVVTLDNSDC